MIKIDETKIEALKRKLAARLLELNTVTADNTFPGPPMTPRAEVLLATVEPSAQPGQAPDDLVKPSFSEYFRFGASKLSYPVAAELKDCLGEFPPVEAGGHSCVRNEGIRALEAQYFQPPPPPPPAAAAAAPGRTLKRLYAGDVLWLFFHERMGVFKMLGALLDDYAVRGRYPLPSSGIQSFILETMTRELKTGSASTVRDRHATYRRCCGLDSDVGAKLGSEATLNTAFKERWELFISRASHYYRERNLASAVQAMASGSSPSVATLTGVKDAVDLLKQALDPFLYGRNGVNTLNGIVWTLGGLALLRDLRTAFGVPPEFVRPHQYVPAAYNALVGGSGPQSSSSNHYTAHRDCAVSGRDLLIQLQALNHLDARPGGDLEVWLVSVEDKVETYRANYRTLTGVDLGLASMRVEQSQPAVMA